MLTGRADAVSCESEHKNPVLLNPRNNSKSIKIANGAVVAV